MCEHVCMYIYNLYIDKVSHTRLTGHENKFMIQTQDLEDRGSKMCLRWARTKLQQFTFSKKIWSLWASLRESCDPI